VTAFEAAPLIKPPALRGVSDCLAFAIGDERYWWQYGLYGGRYRWAEGVDGDGVDSWVQIFLREGYELTDSRDHEAGYEKVAIYIDLVEMQPSHVAKSDGTTWKSKLGKLQDIEHSSLDVLEGDQHCEYGIVERILRRPL